MGAASATPLTGLQKEVTHGGPGYRDPSLFQHSKDHRHVTPAPNSSRQTFFFAATAEGPSDLEIGRNRRCGLAALKEWRDFNAIESSNRRLDPLRVIVLQTQNRAEDGPPRTLVHIQAVVHGNGNHFTEAPNITSGSLFRDTSQSSGRARNAETNLAGASTPSSRSGSRFRPGAPGE